MKGFRAAARRAGLRWPLTLALMLGGCAEQTQEPSPAAAPVAVLPSPAPKMPARQASAAAPRSIVEVQQAFDAARVDFTTEFEKVRPKSEARIEVGLTVLPDGRLDQVTLVSSSVHDAGLEKRLLDRVRALRLAPRDVAAVRYPSYPIVYAPSLPATSDSAPTASERQRARQNVDDVLKRYTTLPTAEIDKALEQLRAKGVVDGTEAGSQVMRSLLTALREPAVRAQMADSMTNAEVHVAARGPIEASSVTDGLFERQGDRAIKALPDPQMLDIMGVMLQLMETATPSECTMFNGKGGRDSNMAMFRMLERQTPEARNRFVADLMVGLHSPDLPPSIAMTDDENELVKLAVRRYVVRLPDADQIRLQQSIGTRESPDRCWGTAQILKGVMASEPALAVKLMRSGVNKP